MTNRSNPNSDKQSPLFKGKVYQIFGFDILIDTKLKAWLLEINDHPSFNVIACKQAMACNHKENGCPISAVDMHVKKQVQFDTMKILLKSRKVPLRDIEDRFRSLERISPNDNVVFNHV